jgi:hypothetical protein
MATKELELAYQRGKIVLEKKGSVTQVAEALVTEEVELPLTGRPFPELPHVREISTSLERKLNEAIDWYGTVNLTERRELTDAELLDLFTEDEILSTVTKQLDLRIKDLREIVRVHMDVRAEEQGRAVARPHVGVEATPREPKGHYLLASAQNAETVLIPGTDKAYSAEYKRGAVTIDADELLRLYETGKINREEYLAFTRETRVLDETKAGKFINDNPERGMEILKLISKAAAPSYSLYLRKA